MRRPPTGETYWHVYTRGARRLALFYDDADYLKFLSLLHGATQLTGCFLLGYCLMSNHYHLIFQGSSCQLTQLMWRLNHGYAMHHNERYKLGGHVFEGPYNAFRQKTFKRLLYKLAYVFMNPVTAGIVRRPEQYRWSGYLSFMGSGGDLLPLDKWLQKSCLGPHLDDCRRGVRDLTENRALFRSEKPKSTPSVKDVNLHQFEWLVSEANRRRPELRDVDPLVLAYYWGTQCGIPPRVMAAREKSPSPKEIRNAVSRLRGRLGKSALVESFLAPP